MNSLIPPHYDCIVLDGTVIVHLLSTAEARTFNEYADKIFIPYLSKQLEHTTRIDIVWDTYQSDSLKESTREKRGKGVRRKVSSHAKLPSNWMDFFRAPNNKSEFFALLTSKVANIDFPPNKAVHVTSARSVISTTSYAMMNCNHEEADTRIIVHVLHALCQGMKASKSVLLTQMLSSSLLMHSSSYLRLNLWWTFGLHLAWVRITDSTAKHNLFQPRPAKLTGFTCFPRPNWLQHHILLQGKG